MFPGEGAQYPNMLADLCLQFPEARAVFDRIDRLYADHPRGHLLSDWVFPRPAFSDDERQRTEARLMELDIAVEAVLARQRRRIRRDAPAGGAVRRDARPQHAASTPRRWPPAPWTSRPTSGWRRSAMGCIASYADAAAAPRRAGGGAARARARRREAPSGSPARPAESCTWRWTTAPTRSSSSGRRRRPRGPGRSPSARGSCREELPYDRAVHTPLFAPFAEDLRATFARTPGRAARGTPLWSCTTAAPLPDDPAAIRELLVEHWTRPVRFRETIEALHDDGARVFLEVGPRGNMTSFMQDILRGRPACVAAADLPRRSGTTQLNHVVGMLAVHDVELDFDYLFARRGAHVIDWRDPEPPSDGRSRPVALGTAWPMLRLSEEAVERVRPSSDAGGQTPAAPPEPVPAPTPAAATEPVPAPVPAAAAANGHGTAERSLVELSEAAPVPTPVAAPLALSGTLAQLPASDALGAVPDEIAYAIDSFLETMEQFLSANEEVMGAYLGAGGAGRPGAAAATAGGDDRRLRARAGAGGPQSGRPAARPLPARPHAGQDCLAYGRRTSLPSR